MKLAIEELRKRLAEECEERISGQRRLERFLQNISLPAKADAAVSDISGAGWWEMAASHLSSLEDRMVTLSEKVKELTSAHNAVVIASGGERDSALEKLQEEVQRLHEDRLTLHQTEELAAQAKEQLKAQTAEVQQVFARWESRFETLCSRVEAESSLRMGETKRRKESEQLLSSLLNDLGDLRKEFNVNTEAASRACESGLIRWGRARGPELESRDLPALPAPSPEPVATLATGTGRWVPVHGLALPVALFTEAHSRLVAHQNRGGFVPTTLEQLKRRTGLSRVWHITLRLTARDTAAWKVQATAS